jgi:hypothetical protein
MRQRRQGAMAIPGKPDHVMGLCNAYFDQTQFKKSATKSFHNVPPHSAGIQRGYVPASLRATRSSKLVRPRHGGVTVVARINVFATLAARRDLGSYSSASCSAFRDPEISKGSSSSKSNFRAETFSKSSLILFDEIRGQPSTELT